MSLPAPKTHKINPERPEPEIIRAAASVIKKGGVVAFPTTGLYGLGTDAFNAAAVDRLFDIKQRSRGKPILILIDSPTQLQGLAAGIPDTAVRFMDYFWPGGVTLVFEAAAGVPEILTASTGKIGIRLARHPIAAALVRAAKGPITGTSANFSGASGCHRIAELSPRLVRRLDFIIDGGPLEGGRGSTVVDVTGKCPRVLREGAVGEREILALVS